MNCRTMKKEGKIFKKIKSTLVIEKKVTNKKQLQAFPSLSLF